MEIKEKGPAAGKTYGDIQRELAEHEDRTHKLRQWIAENREQMNETHFQEVRSRICYNVKRVRTQQPGARSQAKVADESNVTLATLLRVENGLEDVRLSSIVRVAVSLGVTVDDLLRPIPEAGGATEESSAEEVPTEECGAESE